MNPTFKLVLVGLLAATRGFAQSPAIPRQIEVAANECVRFQSVASHGGVRIAITPHGGLAIARVGDDWTEISLGFRTFLRSVTWGNGSFVAVGGSYVDAPGAILSSPDGIHWTRRNRDNKINLYGVVHGGGLYVAVGDHDTILTSQDALSWKRQKSRTSDVLFSSVAFDDGTFVVVGDSGTVLSSTNGSEWRREKIRIAAQDSAEKDQFHREWPQGASHFLAWVEGLSLAPCFNLLQPGGECASAGKRF